MAKKRKKDNKEFRGIELSEKQYQKAVRRAEDPDVIQKLQRIYSSSEESRQSKIATFLAKQASKGFVGTGVTAYKTSPREKRQSAIVRKAISLLAPKGSLVRAITQPKKEKGDRGRGRPRETYKVRVLPSGKVVKVPTHVYKKMLSAEKSQMRLLKAQQLAQVQVQADQLAMQQDPRYQPSAEEQFLAEPDQQHEMDVMRAKQEMEMEQQMQQYAPQQPGVGRKIVKGFGDFGRGLSRLGKAKQQPMVDQFGRVVEQPQFRPQPRGMGVRGEPRVTTVSGRASLLNVPNVFNNPGQSSILWNKNRRRL